ncbi:hypothetical protein JKF63_07568 [Porcisia hertigi]|uniref:Uncharacterized protein n=1 Tax=Porcisia hertigi TaxID=2761500 RepID=A0A837AY76_9TRYP|nr:hypothetical protein JKF63_07568 [Porcisia hertigi]
MAAETERAMNDDGYATYAQHSHTFYDVSHAARRGYGQEGTIFVAVPFSLTDITAETVDTITRRSSAAWASSRFHGTGARERLSKASEPADGDDGFKELRFTAPRCAMTVESLFRQAHRGDAVTVGTIDVVVVSGNASLKNLNFYKPDDVLFPLRAEDRNSSSPSRQGRYSRITCEPPDFASGWDDADYRYRWKDNLRRRRVLVPLTKLEDVATADSALRQRDDAATILEQRFAFPYVGRYAVLQLYRGESYLFFLRTGALVLPNWDLTLRLLYLRTPARERAVLTSRPTPGVAWRALATAVVKTWDTEPFLHFSLTTAPSRRNGEGWSEGDRRAGATVSPLDEMGKRLLAALPANVSLWLSAARMEAELVLWLVTPNWLWPTMLETLEEGRRLAAASTSPSPTTASSSLHSLFSSQAVRDVLGEALTTLQGIDMKMVQVDPVKRADDASAATASSSKQRVVHVRGGRSAATASTAQAFLSASLTTSEVYELLFLTEKRPPMSPPSMSPPSIVDTAQAASTTTPAPSHESGAAADWRELCGAESSEAPYYSPANKALVKRFFEYCWLTKHKGVLLQYVHRLVDSTEATTVLRTVSGTQQAPAECETTAKCRRRKRGFAESEVVPRSSTCLADMRYLEPMEEGPGLAGPGEDTLEAGGDVHPKPQTSAQRSLPQEKAWFMTAANVGQLKGVPTAARVSRAAGHDGAPQFDTAQLPRDALSAPVEPTPYILQAAASADLLFGPAEAFFDFDPEHQLRTRVRGLSEQLEDLRRRRENRSATASHARVPEAVELDSSLQFLDGDFEDIYMTQALWTRGWNLFGLTEPVAVNTDEDEQQCITTTTTATNSAATAPLGVDGGGGEVVQCKPDASSYYSVPSVLYESRNFTNHKFWALVMAHRSAGGMPFGSTVAEKEAATLQSNASSFYPLRRTMKEWELFAGVQLTALKEILMRSQ